MAFYFFCKQSVARGYTISHVVELETKCLKCNLEIVASQLNTYLCPFYGHGDFKGAK